MAKKTENPNETIDTNTGKEVVGRKNDDALLIDEFDIIELEDRLELGDRCNGRCDKH